MKRFLLSLLLLVPLLAIVVGTNFGVDPANLYTSEYEQGIVSYLLMGWNVTRVTNYDEGKLQKLLVRQLKSCPSQVVLGSSRIMLINKKMTGTASFLNNGVSGASLEDIIAIYELYEQRGFRLKNVIIGIDPWLFNAQKEMHWKTLAREYRYFVHKHIDSNAKLPYYALTQQFGRLEQLISLSYFKNSISYVADGYYGSYYPTLRETNAFFTRIADGSITYDAHYLKYDSLRVARAAQAQINPGPVYGLGDFKAFSKRKVRFFEGFISYLQARGAHVSFFVSPFHPFVYDAIKTDPNYRNVFITEHYIKDFARVKGIPVYGSFDPGVNHLTNSDYLDGLHCNQAAIKKIVKDGALQLKH